MVFQINIFSFTISQWPEIINKWIWRNPIITRVRSKNQQYICWYIYRQQFRIELFCIWKLSRLQIVDERCGSVMNMNRNNECVFIFLYRCTKKGFRRKNRTIQNTELTSFAFFWICFERYPPKCPTGNLGGIFRRNVPINLIKLM